MLHILLQPSAGFGKHLIWQKVWEVSGRIKKEPSYAKQIELFIAAL